ncbi:MAG: DUF2130 domain-containing protein [Hyphomicrobiales bacterium]|nr:DUF2130 domain-containing protein [Hyphomicrobiales bacterium]
MSGHTIACPKCSFAFALDESLAGPLVAAARREFEAKLAEKDAAVAAREAKLAAGAEALERRRAALEEQAAREAAAARAKIAEEEASKARLAVQHDLTERANQLSALQEVLAARDAKLAEAQAAQAEMMKRQRALEDAKREMEVTIETRVRETLDAVREKAKQEADQALQLKIVESKEQIASMQRQIEELRRKAEQGSQQLQGEALEVQLEAMLRAKFPHDAFEPVAKGKSGGDVLQRVIGPAGQPCGSILWETKRTKAWSDGWLAKLRDDQRAARADFALLVSNALPKGVAAFDCVDGVWVAETRCALPVAVALRHALIEVSGARRQAEGQQDKMALVYQYLTGPRFRHRVEAIVERFRAMEADLQRERLLMAKQWAKREEQLRGVLDATMGMYGDLQGIAGNALAELDGLEPPLLESPGA